MTYSMDNKGNFPGFTNWLYATAGADLTTGTFYPYIKAASIYMCPTDKLALDAKIKPKAPAAPTFGNNRRHRDYSYGMNCGICHATDASAFLAPSRTLLFMEGDLAPDDYTGLVGSALVDEKIALRHNRHGHLLMSDLSIGNMETNEFKQVAKTKRFWFPTDDTTGMNGAPFGQGLQ
jgi:hypothetical protein